MTDAIKPCPCCDSSDVRWMTQWEAAGSPAQWVADRNSGRVRCFQCGIQTEVSRSMKVTIERWNRRPSPDSERVRELEAQLAEANKQLNRRRVTYVCGNCHGETVCVSPSSRGRNDGLPGWEQPTSPAPEKVKHRPENVRCTRNASDHVDMECDCRPAPEKAKSCEICGMRDGHVGGRLCGEKPSRAKEPQ